MNRLTYLPLVAAGLVAVGAQLAQAGPLAVVSPARSTETCEPTLPGPSDPGSDRIRFAVIAPAGDVPDAPAVAPSTTLSDLLLQLGEPRPHHWIEGTDEQVRQGREIVLEGRTSAEGRPSRVASPGFLCTDCHNVQREDPDLRVSDPDARLPYVVASGQPFLPGTTLWGTVNRASWFNDDYVRKYGTLVQPANASLREAVRLCAAECSQGRLMDEWEIDAILAYLWTLEITLADLDLSEPELRLVAAGVADPAWAERARSTLRSGWLQAAPAHVREAPADRTEGYGNTGDPARGEQIFEHSCLTCHEAEKGDRRGVRGSFPLDARRPTIAMLWRNRASSTNLSVHQVITHGTRPYGVPMAYMPFFTKERLSDQQVDDLLAYLRSVAEGAE